MAYDPKSIEPHSLSLVQTQIDSPMQVKLQAMPSHS